MIPESPMNVLLVDDRPENLVALEALLEDFDLQVHKAESGNEALGLMLQHEFAVVLMDVQMPGMDGFETVELMRTSKRTAHVPVVFISAISKDQRFVFQGYEVGAVDYLFKPIQPDVLRGKVRVFVDLFRQRRAAERANEETQRVLERLRRSENALQEAYEELVTRRDEALAATRAKSQFLANMSHEIRTPMNAIIGMTELLLTTELSDDQMEFAETIREAGDALLALINDILDFSKIESGKMDLEAIPFDVRSVVEAVGELLAPRAGEKELELTAFADPGMDVRLVGDPGRVRQVLLNLAGNAIKFTHEGGVYVLAEPGPLGDGEPTIRFSVKDTGIGIPEERLEAVFEEFAQADGSTTRRFGGTGLGLSICKRLVALMGGEMGVDSTVGEGSVFWFTLPVTGPQDRGAAFRGTDCGSVAGSRVLVVDDDPVSRAAIAATLSAAGCICDTADGGEEALSALRAAASSGQVPDVVLLDQQMPGMSGDEVLTAMQGEPALVGVAAVLLSPVGRPRDPKAAEAFPDAVHLAKPVRRTRMLAAVGQCIVTRARRTPAPSPAPPPADAAPAAAKAARILLAEDTEVNQLVARRILESAGHSVDIVADGQAAVDAFEPGRYDMVLLDVQMPKMDGFQVAAEIRARQDGADRTPLVAITANALKGDRERCLEAGMDDYLAKPVRPATLLAMVERWTSQESPAEETVAGTSAGGRRKASKR